MDIELELVKLCNEFLVYVNELYEDDSIDGEMLNKMSGSKMQFLQSYKDKLSSFPNVITAQII
ncbi:MAG TPA: hypothetical protein VIO64_15410 [Pseudobacteroides sp.]|uniref:hypothetical protein n=1 Tax=Pseudobacteroides sp. TaxID=1968840 RepID=UPI002F92DC75